MKVGLNQLDTLLKNFIEADEVMMDQYDYNYREWSDKLENMSEKQCSYIKAMFYSRKRFKIKEFLSQFNINPK
jgi:hypothetical protein